MGLETGGVDDSVYLVLQTRIVNHSLVGDTPNV